MIHIKNFSKHLLLSTAVLGILAFGNANGMKNLQKKLQDKKEQLGYLKQILENTKKELEELPPTVGIITEQLNFNRFIIEKKPIKLKENEDLIKVINNTMQQKINQIITKFNVQINNTLSQDIEGATNEFERLTPIAKKLTSVINNLVKKHSLTKKNFNDTNKSSEALEKEIITLKQKIHKENIRKLQLEKDSSDDDSITEDDSLEDDSDDSTDEEEKRRKEEEEKRRKKEKKRRKKKIRKRKKRRKKELSEEEKRKALMLQLIDESSSEEEDEGNSISKMQNPGTCERHYKMIKGAYGEIKSIHSCGHKFHPGCLNEWKKNVEGDCPICDGQACYICCEPFNNTEHKIVFPPCQHKICRKCEDDIKGRNRGIFQCPMCRQNEEQGLESTKTRIKKDIDLCKKVEPIIKEIIENQKEENGLTLLLQEHTNINGLFDAMKDLASLIKDLSTKYGKPFKKILDDLNKNNTAKKKFIVQVYLALITELPHNPEQTVANKFMDIIASKLQSEKSIYAVNPIFN